MTYNVFGGTYVKPYSINQSIKTVKSRDQQKPKIRGSVIFGRKF